MSVYLASHSPRRYTILTELGVFPQVIPHRLISEAYPSSGQLAHAMTSLCEAKARSVLPDVLDEQGIITDDVWVISGDTVVIHSPNQPLNWQDILIETVHIFGKPTTADEARGMLMTLESVPHGVMSGLSIWHPKSNRIQSGVAVATVQLSTQSDQQRNHYIATGAPFDKAGGYGVQDGLVAWFEGEESTILGLSKTLFLQLSEYLGLRLGTV